MRVPFRKTTPPAAVRAVDPVLAAEQRRRVIEYGRTESELETDTTRDASQNVAEQAAAEESGASAAS